MSKSKNTKPLVITLVIVLLVGAFAYGVVRIVQLRKATASLGGQVASANDQLSKLKNDLVSDPNGTVAKVQQESTGSVLEEVAKLYELPKDESPTIATVQDKSKLAGQAFFDQAENGDQLVVYEKSGLAILYRPSQKKLVKVGPIDIKNETPTTQVP